MKIDRHPITDRASWLAMRRADVTASDIAAVFGLHPWRTPLQLWADKTGLDIETPENAAMRRGRWFEDAVIAACRDAHPDWTIEKPGIYLRAPEYRIGATPDAVAGDVAIQCKTVAEQAFASQWADGPPIHYQLQTMTEAMLLGVSHAILAVLVISPYGADYREFDIPRHAAAEARILAAVPEFWAKIGRGETPKADYAADADVIAMLHAPDAAKPPLDLSTDNYLPTLLAEYETARAAASEADDQVTGLKAQIVEKLAGATMATLPGWRITNRIQSRKETVVKATSFPVLRITRKSEEQAA